MGNDRGTMGNDGERGGMREQGGMMGREGERWGEPPGETFTT